MGGLLIFSDFYHCKLNTFGFLDCWSYKNKQLKGFALASRNL